MLKSGTTILSLTVLAVLSAGSAHAADKIVASVSTDTKDGATFSQVTYSYETCEEECQVAQLVCEESTAISLVMADVSSADASKAITQEQTQIQLKAGSQSFSYFVYEMQFMEMTGSWWLTAREQGSPPLAIAKAIAGAKAIELKAGKMKVSLPVDQAVKTWALACK
jgi:hypothetical protein